MEVCICTKGTLEYDMLRFGYLDFASVFYRMRLKILKEGNQVFRFGTHDVVVLKLNKADLGSPALGQGVVYRLKDSSITAAFDDIPEDGLNNPLRLKKIANKVTYHRMKEALVQLSKGVHKGPASDLIPVLFGERHPRSPIRIFKNVRGITEREIIVRDSNRFHHFKDGICSCGKMRLMGMCAQSFENLSAIHQWRIVPFYRRLNAFQQARSFFNRRHPKFRMKHLQLRPHPPTPEQLSTEAKDFSVEIPSQGTRFNTFCIRLVTASIHHIRVSGISFNITQFSQGLLQSDDKAFELNKLQTSLYEEFFGKSIAAIPPVPVEVAHSKVSSDVLNANFLTVILNIPPAFPISNS
ncbi:hypothetical protein KIW84_UN0001 [Lathyrus oleraceus]|nr:hypothetical protein KIW84_UN0001 [Pisum sativum]